MDGRTLIVAEIWIGGLMKRIDHLIIRTLACAGLLIAKDAAHATKVTNEG